MIARPHICLRCQLRLTKHPASRLQSTDSKPPPRADARTRLASVRDRILENGPPTAQRNGAWGFTRPLKNISARDPRGDESDEIRLHGLTGQQQWENRESLPIDSLGRPSEVIILRDSKVKLYRPRDFVLPPSAGQAVDIQAVLDSERGLPGLKEINENIDSLRPNEGEEDSLNAGEFNKLFAQLQKGFTSQQLARYMQDVLVKDKLNESVASHDSPLLRVSPWVPGISESSETLWSSTISENLSKSYTSKQRLVLRLMRECWGVKVPDVEDGIGQIELELVPKDMDCLLNGSRDQLSEIYSAHIVHEEERMEIFQSVDALRKRNAIRVTTWRHKCNALVQDIENVLRTIQRAQIPLASLVPFPKGRKVVDRRSLASWINTTFDEETLEELRRLTKMDIRRQGDSNGQVLSLSYMGGPDSTASQRTPFDVARRLVLTAGEFSDRVSSSLGSRDLPQSSKGSFVSFPNIEGLGWRDRLRKWTRWATPLSKLETEKPEIEQDNPSKPEETTEKKSSNADYSLAEALASFNLQETKEGSQQSISSSNLQTDKESVYWDNEYQSTSSALLGTILHHHPNPSNNHSSIIQPSDSSAVINSFSTKFPNLTRVLANSRIERKSRSLVMHFQPNPFFKLPSAENAVGSAVLSVFPPVEIRFSIDIKKEITLQEIRAIIATKNSDIMLPDSPNDIRFQQKTSSKLNGILERVSDFLERSNLSLRAGQEKLDTPPSIIFPIASHLCKKPGFEILGLENMKNEMQEVEYLFTGLQLENGIEMDFEGWSLLYTSVEGGKAGGRRGELRLQAIRTKPSDYLADTSNTKFVDSAFRLANIEDIPLKPTRTVTKPSLNSKGEENIVRKVKLSPEKEGAGRDTKPRTEIVKHLFRGSSLRDTRSAMRASRWAAKENKVPRTRPIEQVGRWRLGLRKRGVQRVGGMKGYKVGGAGDRFV